MKKLFTLIALLACVLGANADWKEDYKIDYSTHTGFPFYVMGFVPEWVDGVMTDFGAMYSYKTDADMEKEDALKEGDVEVGTVTTEGGVTYHKIQLAAAGWHQYFIADGINTGDMADTYVVKAMVKASEPCTINVNMGWGWGDGQSVGAQVAIGTDWEEVEWEYSGIGGASCNLVAQPGTCTATIEWKYLTVGHNEKASRPTVWQEWLTSDGKPVIVETTSDAIPTYMGNAETPWADANVQFNDQENNNLICAWSKERMRNLGEPDAEGKIGWNPFPSDIEEVDGSKVFVCHGKAAITEGDAAAWDNQFWIQSPKAWKSGDQVKIHFRYKASEAAKASTQIHKQNPSDYLIWHAIGDINFTTEWQEFDGTMTFADDMNEGWSIAFNLNAENKNEVTFYFDDLSWQSMKLDEGFFVAGANPNAGLAYDFDNAIQFTDEDGDGEFEAVIGTKDEYVSQVMISTVRGNDAAFKSNTLKPNGTIANDPDNWMDYTPGSNAKLNLPGAGIWKIWIDTNYTSMAFEMLEGEAIVPKEINPNPTEIVINAVERDYLTADNDGNPREAEIGTGQPWDNQFFLKANRTLATGEATIVQFKYKAAKAAKSTTQCHGEPGAYKHWAAIGDVNFTEEWQDFEAKLTVASEANEMQSIAFNLAEIKEANVYEIKDVVWKLDDDTESLIDQTGAANFFIKVGAGTSVINYADAAGIDNIVANKKSSAAIYNLAGQRVSNDYKGIVVKNGKKAVVK